jgi:hypothetical protein
MADPDSVVEYSALQATIIGLRGMLAPFIGIGLVGLGLPEQWIFAIGCAFIAAGWLTLGALGAAGSRQAAVGSKQ